MRISEEIFNKAKELISIGYYIGPRDPKRNKAFRGAYMVCEDTTTGPSDDAGNGGFCIVGNDLTELVEDAHIYAFPE